MAAGNLSYINKMHEMSNISPNQNTILGPMHIIIVYMTGQTTPDESLIRTLEAISRVSAAIQDFQSRDKHMQINNLPQWCALVSRLMY